MEVDDFDQLFAWVFFAVDQSRYSGGVYHNVHMLMCALIYITCGGFCLCEPLVRAGLQEGLGGIAADCRAASNNSL